MAARDLCKQCALCQQHKGKQGIKGTQRHRQVQASQPIARAVGPPWEPGEKESQ